MGLVVNVQRFVCEDRTPGKVRLTSKRDALADKGCAEGCDKVHIISEAESSQNAQTPAGDLPVTRRNTGLESPVNRLARKPALPMFGSSALGVAFRRGTHSRRGAPIFTTPRGETGRFQSK